MIHWLIKRVQHPADVGASGGVSLHGPVKAESPEEAIDKADVHGHPVQGGRVDVEVYGVVPDSETGDPLVYEFDGEDL